MGFGEYHGQASTVHHEYSITNSQSPNFQTGQRSAFPIFPFPKTTDFTLSVIFLQMTIEQFSVPDNPPH